MDATDDLRVARTESLFRDVNERISESASRFGSDDATFVCECSDPTCTNPIDAPMETYEDVREDGARFLLANGHERGDIERVVRRRSRYQIVEKVRPRVRDIVERLNPRASTT